MLLDKLSIGSVEFMTELSLVMTRSRQSRTIRRDLEILIGQEIAGSKNVSGKWECPTGKVAEGGNTPGHATSPPEALGMQDGETRTITASETRMCAMRIANPVYPKEVSAVEGLPCLEQTVDPGGS